MRRLTLPALALPALALLALTSALPVTPLRAEDAAGKIVYSRKSGEQYKLHVMNPDGSGDKELPGQTSNVNLFATWSPDGKKIAYMASPVAEFKEAQLYIINADGSNAHPVPTNAKLSGLPAWSPDGRQLAYVSGDDMPRVFVADGEGNSARQVSPEDAGAFFPFWTADGKKLGFTRIRRQPEEQADIVLGNPDGTGTETLISGEKKILFGNANALSPDGKRLLFIALDMPAGTGALHILDLASKADTTVTDVKIASHEAPDSFPVPSWAPDGKSILINLATDKGQGVFLLSEDGQKKKRLTPEGVDCVHPVWFASR
ncbi:MAG TPA: hypothetical protein VFU47_11205 [Armatimonadota bacterium]|nr:hypothetical protein [Armatimonadota bacterium]